MTDQKQASIKKELERYHLLFRKDGEPIAVNFRELTKELNKGERYTHQIHSYPAKLLTNIPYYFLATNALCPIGLKYISLSPYTNTSTLLPSVVVAVCFFHFELYVNSKPFP